MSAVPVPDDLEPVIRENQREREAHEVELACESEGHAWIGRTVGDPIHGLCGTCGCGGRLFTLTGEELDI